jgi:hypothetical protein
MQNFEYEVSLMQCHRVLPILATAFMYLGVAEAQILSQREVGGKTVMCMQSGLSSDLKDCGNRSDWYAYVFVGSIFAINSIANDEKEIQIVPEEIFSGNPEVPLNVLTSQALCLPKLAIGDRWLFYLRKEKSKPIVLDYYGNDSRPVADVQKQIATLRRLKNIGGAAILQGQVVRGNSFDGKAVANARVTATGQLGDEQYVSTTDEDGRYEFEPLLPGKYKITVEHSGTYKPDDSAIELRRGACWDLTLSRSPHARIRGHVSRSDGSPVSGLDVVLVDSGDVGYSTIQTDKSGKFEFSSLTPGQFVVGIDFPNSPDWFNGSGGGSGVAIPPASMFYPGVVSRANAKVIRLETDEKLDNIDFVVPVQ